MPLLKHFSISDLPQGRTLFFFMLVCLAQSALQYISWTFQGARVMLHYQDMRHVGVFFALLMGFSFFFFTVVTPYLMRRTGNVRLLFASSLFLQNVSFWTSLITYKTLGFALFAFLNGAALGLFWSTRHWFELLNTDENSGVRDRINSIMSCLHQLNLIVLPFGIAFLSVFATRFFSTDAFTPVVVLISTLLIPALYFCFQIQAPRPQLEPLMPMLRIGAQRVIKRQRRLNQYWLIDGIHWSLRNLSIALSGALVAKTLTSIGTNEGAGAFVAWLLLTLLIPFSKPQRRHYFYFLGALGISACWIFLGITQSIYAFLILAVGKAFFTPLFDVGNHLYSQKTVELLRHDIQKHFKRQHGTLPDFSSVTLATLMVRESVLFTFRSATLIVVPFSMFIFWDSSTTQLVVLSCALALFASVMPWFARRYLHHLNPVRRDHTT